MHFALFEVGLADFVDGAEGAVHAGAGHEVFETAAIESRSFSGFAEVKVRDDPRLTVDFDFQSFFQIRCTVHGYLF